MTYTRQQLFDMAVRGLHAQEWRRAYDPVGATCMYAAPNGDRCAWGHCDLTLDASVRGSVMTLRAYGVGLAADLDDLQLVFARELQIAHDSSPSTPNHMRQNFRELAAAYNLVWPKDIP